MSKMGTHRNRPTSDTCFRLVTLSLIRTPIILSERKVNIITCIQLPPAQPMEHFLLNYCFNDSSSELLPQATLRSIQKHKRYAHCKSFTEYCARTKNRWFRMNNAITTHTTYKSSNVIIFLDQQVIAKPAYQQCSVQLFTQKCVKFFWTFKNNYPEVCPSNGKDCSKNEITLLKNIISKVL